MSFGVSHSLMPQILAPWRQIVVLTWCWYTIQITCISHESVLDYIYWWRFVVTVPSSQVKIVDSIIIGICFEKGVTREREEMLTDWNEENDDSCLVETVWRITSSLQLITTHYFPLDRVITCRPISLRFIITHSQLPFSCYEVGKQIQMWRETISQVSTRVYT